MERFVEELFCILWSEFGYELDNDEAALFTLLIYPLLEHAVQCGVTEALARQRPVYPALLDPVSWN